MLPVMDPIPNGASCAHGEFTNSGTNNATITVTNYYTNTIASKVPKKRFNLIASRRVLEIYPVRPLSDNADDRSSETPGQLKTHISSRRQRES